MKVLVACEYSQVVQDAFLRKGCDSYSCDIIETNGPNPDRHRLKFGMIWRVYD